MSNLDKKRLDLEVAEFRLDCRNSERAYISQLMSNIKYLNGLKDGYCIEINTNTTNRTISQEGRNLNAHEEDLYNYSLIMAKCLIAKDYPAKTKKKKNDK